MQRYFLEKEYIDGELFYVDGDDFHHMTRVMRMKEGDKFFVVFKGGKSAISQIESISSDDIKASIVQWETAIKELPITVTIASGLPKGDKLEWIIQKGTELGAHEFIPFNADRSIVKWDEKKAKKKVERWEKIAKEAAEQSHRRLVPKVFSPHSFSELIDMSNQYEYKLIAYEEESRACEIGNFAHTISSMKNGSRILIIFGPEGGLTEQEVMTSQQFGFLPCGLGPRILRAETAPLYVLSAISYQFELMR
ncbi:16S rRNA (uracil1498-N3)-methyltransferase [Bacillus pakistanensis]|uniref:Ribosomal RNA small subunit methyltransferase E n=1 Tax=Rossellomorea pakistanensis TaxID=992288 RepID=A0ABS2NAE5_9BACI|nr:16S rRNA (uracil(1498)-N(3))-methyltransferase [Bacillus pakistanensis]MBM7584734.1 16S rRNA (uracil1498-N3)-methyltransferase [Bacillus pakistanensis]